MTALTHEVNLLDFEPQIRAAANTLNSIGHDQRPEVSAQDALAGLEGIPQLHRTEKIREAVTTLERCVMAKQLGRELDVLASKL